MSAGHSRASSGQARDALPWSCRAAPLIRFSCYESRCSREARGVFLATICRRGRDTPCLTRLCRPGRPSRDLPDRRSQRHAPAAGIAIPAYTGSVLVSYARSLIETIVPTALPQRQPHRSVQHGHAERYRIVIQLSSGLEAAFAPQDAQGLQDASPPDLAVVEIDLPGFGIRFPRLVADLYLPVLLEGFFGSKTWAAARLGQAGGLTSTPAKQEAARANGRHGGRSRSAA
jgi:hypothetical protein